LFETCWGQMNEFIHLTPTSLEQVSNKLPSMNMY